MKQHLIYLGENEEIGQEIAVALKGKVRSFSSVKSFVKMTDLSIYSLLFCDADRLFELEKFTEKSSEKFKNLKMQIPFVLLCSKQDIARFIPFIKRENCHYLSYPIIQEELVYLAERVLQKGQVQKVSTTVPDDVAMMRSYNPVMRDFYRQLQLVAQQKTTVLLTGETGVGKSAIARLLHDLSPRQNEPFVSLHCSALPGGLLESELFGHEKGAFTGAFERKIGKFEQAQGGTIFLDEIGTVSPAIQVKLLQVLQDRSLQRIGGRENVQIDIRIIAATNESLEELSENGAFRKDLFYRLNVFSLRVPALRERHEDIPLIVQSLINRFNLSHQKSITGIHPILLEALQAYPCPGNIRELENLVERAFILEQSHELTLSSFPTELFSGIANSPLTRQQKESLTLKEIRQEVVSQVEEEYLKTMLTVHTGSIQKTAVAVGITTRQLHKLMLKYSLDKKDFKVLN